MINVKTVNNIVEAFPVGILAQTEVLTPEENDLLIAKVYNLRNTFGAGNTQDWLSGKASPDNCYRQSNIAEYLEFRPLVERITQCVRELARSYGSDDYYNFESQNQNESEVSARPPICLAIPPNDEYCQPSCRYPVHRPRWGKASLAARDRAIAWAC